MQKEKKTLFDAWMHFLSPSIQHTAVAYGERFSAEELSRTIASADKSIRYVCSSAVIARVLMQLCVAGQSSRPSCTRRFFTSSSTRRSSLLRS